MSQEVRSLITLLVLSTAVTDESVQLVLTSETMQVLEEEMEVKEARKLAANRRRVAKAKAKGERWLKEVERKKKERRSKKV
ncbi:hypothetical protein V6N11_054489 [Hibiscus sabdariffa]|uniref:Uncharacterized protein n=1 Tax=Hibiscus sabdariffa TaxID=183260 RepID=A0ABR2S421_9ROSI